MLNSLYGGLANEWFRFFDVRMAEGITSAGQVATKNMERWLNVYLNSITKTNKDIAVYADTDSLYISLEDIVNAVFKDAPDTKKVIKFMDKVCSDRITPEINRICEELKEYVNAKENSMVMKREALIDSAIWVAKKRYILSIHNNEGVEYAEPKVKVTGLESVRSSTPMICRNKIKETYTIMLSGDEMETRKYIAAFKDEFTSAPLADVSFPRGVNGMVDYKDKSKQNTTMGTPDIQSEIRRSPYIKGTPIHTKGALIYNHLLDTLKLTKKYPKITDGDKIKFVYLKMPNIINSEVIAFQDALPREFKLDDKVDYAKQYEKTYLEPIKNVLNVLGWKAEEESSLEDLFG